MKEFPAPVNLCVYTFSVCEICSLTDTRSVVLILTSDTDSTDNLQFHAKLTENLKIW